VKDKGGLCARSLCTNILQRIVKVEEGERHFFEKGIVKMEVIPNLCASREVMHEDHARRA
jgi:hypothetical protein